MSNTTDVRRALKQLMQETLGDEYKNHTWTYRAIRPLAIPPSWAKGLRVVGDCSKGVQYLCKWAGMLNDPMGMNWGVYGNSTNLCLHLQHLDHRYELRVGDIVTFGAGGDKHAAMVYEPGSDPLVWSFGHQGAPNTYRLSQDHRQQQYLRIPTTDLIVLPEDKLRAKQGYFSWVAWKLGEGHWAPYGKANPKVRPHVPKVISPVWQWRYSLFLANRNRGNKATTGK